MIPGYLTDHYDVGASALFLTEGIAASRSVTAMGIVAHEVLHAAQDLEGYPLMRIRSWLGERLVRVPNIAFWGILLGLTFRWPIVVMLGGLIMLASVVLGLTALPVERNASGRALVALQESG
ncbi:MAG: zinc metallopeptidase [Anaerolineae bacterium]